MPSFYTSDPTSFGNLNMLARKLFLDGNREKDIQKEIIKHVEDHTDDPHLLACRKKMATGVVKKVAQDLVPAKKAYKDKVRAEQSQTSTNPVAGLTEMEQGRKLLRDMLNRNGSILLGRSGWPPDNRVVDKLVKKGLATRGKIVTGPKSSYTKLSITKEGYALLAKKAKKDQRKMLAQAFEKVFG